MGNNEDFLQDLLPENYKYQIDIWFKAYNISIEKLTLFYDFQISLFQIVEETYLGSDIMILQKHQREHFTWCWNKIITDFSKEKIYFKNDDILFEYFWNFYYEAYYLNQINSVKIRILEYFKILFDFNHVKTRSEMDDLTELYKLMNETLKK
jgi:hypothetical protein